MYGVRVVVIYSNWVIIISYRRARGMLQGLVGYYCTVSINRLRTFARRCRGGSLPYLHRQWALLGPPPRLILEELGNLQVYARRE